MRGVGLCCYLRAIVGLALAGLLLSGCNSIEGGPPRLFPVAMEADIARGRLMMAEEAYYTPGSAKTKAIRNEIITTRMREIDSHYYAFEASLIRERQEAGFVSSIVSLGLTGAIPLVGSLGTKSALGAASTFVQGGTKAFSDEVLFQKTVQVLASQMRSHRAFVAAQIIDRMRRLDIDAYPLPMALGDVDEYYAAGTIAGALIEIQKTVAAQSTEAEAAKAGIMLQGGVFQPNEDTTKRLVAYLTVSDKTLRAKRLKEMGACLFDAGFRSGSGGPPDPMLFLGQNQLRPRQIMRTCAQANGDPM